MNPCKECVKVYDKTPCNSLGHCAFEGTEVKPIENAIKAPAFEQRLIA